MKKIALCSMMALFLSLSFYPFQSSAAKNAAPSTLVVPKSGEATEAKTLVLRLNEIKAMDKTNLNSAEKKNLRKEVRATKHQLREISGGVYLSVGAVLLIALLLIVLL
jgi:tRNA pseudouridine-54 N-methylase